MLRWHWLCICKAPVPFCGCLHMLGHLADHRDQRVPQEPRSSGPRIDPVKLPRQQWPAGNQKHPNRMDYLLWVSPHALKCSSFSSFMFKLFYRGLWETNFCNPPPLPAATTARAVWPTWPSPPGWSPVSTTTCPPGPWLWTLRHRGGMRMFP